MTLRRPPAPLYLPAVAGVLFLSLPVAGLLLRVPWGRLPALVGSETVRTALRLSLECSLLSLGLCFLLGVPLALVLARSEIAGLAALRAVVTLPMVLPPVVGGIALLDAFGRRGVAGPVLAAAGIHLPFSTAGAVVAETFVALPFLVIVVEAGLRQADGRLEEAAATLGAGAWRRLVQVTLPAVAPAVLAGGALSWARALGEFGCTLTFAGNLPGATQTMPLAAYVALENDPDAALALSLILLAVSLTVLVALRHRWLGTR
ncbi:MAG: ABC transporter permease [Candidatus Dormibacteria bacterium]